MYQLPDASFQPRAVVIGRPSWCAAMQARLADIGVATGRDGTLTLGVSVLAELPRYARFALD